MSREVRTLTARRTSSRSSTSSLSEMESHHLVGWLLDRREKHLKTDHIVRPLVQMFQVESGSARHALVRTLTDIKGKEVTRTLAERAVFDLAPGNRRAAIAALKERSAEEARPALLAALSYPWAPAGDHAALALLEIDDTNAIPHLEEM